MKLLERLRQPGGAGEAFRFSDYPMHYFAAIQRRNQVNLERELEKIDITPIEWRVIGALHERGGLTVNDLTEITVFDRFKVSRCLSRLTERGLVHECQTDLDKRRKRSVLSDAGLEKFRAAVAIVSKVYLVNLDGISEEELETLMRLLQRIKDNVHRVEKY
jgi:DNA-binding MarR family transcriptional regulator